MHGRKEITLHLNPPFYSPFPFSHPFFRCLSLYSANLSHQKPRSEKGSGFHRSFWNVFYLSFSTSSEHDLSVTQEYAGTNTIGKKTIGKSQV